MYTQSDDGLTDNAPPRTALTRFATFSGGLIAILLLSNWPTYSYVIHGGLVPLVYYSLPALAALAIASLQPDVLVRFAEDKIFLWFVTYVISGLAWLLLSQDFLDAANAQWRLRVLAVLLFSTAIIITNEAHRRILAWLILACAALAAALNWFDVMFPFRLVPAGTEQSNPGRGAGLFINANAAAGFILMAAIAALPYTPMRFRAVVLIGATLGVLPTFSRFGMMMAVLLVILAGFGRMLDRKQIMVLLAAIPLLALGFGAYHQFVMTTEGVDAADMLGRLAWFQTLGKEVDFSAEERAYVAEHAWQMFLASPLYGQGIGATTRGVAVGTHNMYVLLMAEQGIFGLALYLSLVAILAYRGSRLVRNAADLHGRDMGMTVVVYAVFLSLYGLVSHNVLEEPHGILLMAFLIAGEVNAARIVENAPTTRS